MISAPKATFKLSENFLQQYEGNQPNWGFGDLSYFTFKRTYARMMENGAQEEFVDTLARVTNGTFRAQETYIKSHGLPWDAWKAQRSAQEFFRRMWDFKFLPPGRGLWIMGTPLVDKIGSSALNNCGFISTQDIEVEFGSPFAWAMDMLMLGVGVGFDTRGAKKVTVRAPSDQILLYEIPDTREGWVESVRLLLNSYQTGRNTIKFNYDRIRKQGEPINGFGGIASGPQPLIDLHNSARKMLDSLVGQEITSVVIVDIMNFIGRCVVAGNVRRSAELAIGDIDDHDYVIMKDKKKFKKELNDRRWASNNSVFARPDSDFSKVANGILGNGEPGLIFLDNARHRGRFKDGFFDESDDRYDRIMGFNPCGEQGLESHELCCLVETFPANHDSFEDYHRTLKFAYMYAKTVTLIPTHDERTNMVMMRNRRIGCSMSGIQQAMQKFGRNRFLLDFCDKGYDVIRRWDRLYSEWLATPRSKRMTTVKPSGTVSLLAGAFPGVHFTHSEHYLRTIRVGADSEYVDVLFNAKYRIEFDVTNKEKLARALKVQAGEDPSEATVDAYLSKSCDDLTLIKAFGCENGTVVVYFPVEEKNFTKSKFDVTLWEQLMTVREMQHYWSDNAVSCTVSVKKEEQKDVLSAIEFFAPYVKTLSFLPLEDHAYEQAPYQECTAQEYKEYKKTLGPVDFSSAALAQVKGSKFCDGDKCEI